MSSDPSQEVGIDTPLSPKEYEAYIEELVGNLLPFSGAAIRRNQRMAVVRQPGEYEIDVVAEFIIGDKLRFLLIVECKNWSKPVGRDVIQKLAQTRDAIAAHKAVVCSPVGFTKEAIEVAKAHGIALWVIAAQRHGGEARWSSISNSTISAHVSDEWLHREQVERRTREALLRLWRWSIDDAAAPLAWHLKNFEDVGHAKQELKLNGIRGRFRTQFDASSVHETWLAPFLFEEIFNAAESMAEIRTEISEIREQCERSIQEEKLERRRQSAFDRAAFRIGLNTDTRCRVFEHLGNASRSLSIAEINVGVPDWAIELAVSTLESMGYVESAAADSGRIAYHLTPHGATEFAAIVRQIDKELSDS